MNRSWPYTPDELRTLADKVEEVLNTLDPKGDIPDGDWRWGVTVDILDEHGDPAGTVKPYGDGWLGFYPREVN
jgi:hypothetical protein